MNRTVLTLRVCGWSSIAMGLIFFLIPGWYAELEGATTDNIAVHVQISRNRGRRCDFVDLVLA